MLFSTSEAHETLREKIRSFAEDEIKPIAFKLDRENEFPHESIKKLAKMGMMGIPYPKEYGGAGLDVISYAIAVEELSRVDGGAGVILSAHVSRHFVCVFCVSFFAVTGRAFFVNSRAVGRK